MRKIYIKYSVAFYFLLASFSTISAQVNTLYYMKNVPLRHELNPAFQPISKVYIDLPIIPSLKIEVGNNSVSLSDIVYPKMIEGQMRTITFLDSAANKNDFYDALRKKTRFYSEVEVGVLSFGFRAKQSYITFGINQKFSMGAIIPKDLFKLGLYGSPDTTSVNSYNLKSLTLRATSYTEIALGYSREIDDKLVVGGKAKLLLGQANVSTKIKDLSLDVSRDYWDINIKGEANASLPYSTYTVDEENKLDDINIEEPNSNNSSNYSDLFLKPAGLGFGIDLGATYKLKDNLTLSASLLDLGYIHWRKGVANAPVDGSYRFEGCRFDVGDDSTDWVQKIVDDFSDTIHYRTTFNAYNTMLSPKVLTGVEYSILNEKISFGLLSKTTIFNKSIFEEVTTSANFFPINWFNASLSYSWVNGRFSNFGVGLGGRSGIYSMYIAGDYFPARYTPDGVPYNTKAFNLQLGLVLTFGNPKQDKDRDGVKNRKDQCPDTPFGEKVNKVGCSLDADKDGVTDDLDQCPNTPLGVFVDSVGCPLDTDRDSVLDYIDQCPNTPIGVPVDSIGCPFDADGDGVSDYKDKCPNTQKGVSVDSIGCPLDGDKDGVADYIDECPGTPQNAIATVDKKGCPKDTDGDGVADYMDKCPGTPLAAKGYVDISGCPLDTDLDGIADYKDNCPTIPGVVTNFGCPEVKAAVKKIFEKALQGIQFESGKDIIKPVSYPILNQIVTIMIENKDYLIDINGHTDNVGVPAKNLILSENRAKSVKSYLTSKGVEESRINTKGFGDGVPVADNATAQGRAKNRRVEFVVRFER